MLRIRTQWKPTWRSRLAFWGGLVVGLVGSVFFFTDTAQAPEHTALWPIVMMIVGGAAFAFSGRFESHVITRAPR